MPRFRVLVFVTITVLSIGVIVGVSSAEEVDGKAVFEAKKCNMCHSVSSAEIEAKSEKMFKGDLVNLDQDAEWLAQYLRKEVQKDHQDHKKEFKGSDEELQALIAWLLEQKTEE